MKNPCGKLFPLPLPEGETFVCVLDADHKGKHQTSTGIRWDDGPAVRVSVVIPSGKS